MNVLPSMLKAGDSIGFSGPSSYKQTVIAVKEQPHYTRDATGEWVDYWQVQTGKGYLNYCTKRYTPVGFMPWRFNND